MEIPVPKEITDKILALNNLVRQYPNSIPVSVAAGFIGMDERSLKAYLMQPYSFGMGWRRDGVQNRGFKIPTVKFYLWYRGLAGREA